MGRPRVYSDRITTQIRFDSALHERLHAAATERQVSVNLLVNRAGDEFLDRLIPVDEIQWTRKDDNDEPNRVDR